MGNFRSQLAVAITLFGAAAGAWAQSVPVPPPAPPPPPKPAPALDLGPLGGKRTPPPAPLPTPGPAPAAKPSPLPVPSPLPTPKPAPAVPSNAEAWLGPAPARSPDQWRALALAALNDAKLGGVDDGDAVRVAVVQSVARRFKRTVCTLGSCRDEFRPAGTVTASRDWVTQLVAVGGPGGTWQALALLPATGAPTDGDPPPPGWTEVLDPIPLPDFQAANLALLRSAGVAQPTVCGNRGQFQPALAAHLQSLCARSWSTPAARSDPSPAKDEDDDEDERPAVTSRHMPPLSFTAAQYSSFREAGRTNLDWALGVQLCGALSGRGSPTVLRVQLLGTSPKGLNYALDLLAGWRWAGQGASLRLAGGVGVAGATNQLPFAVEFPARVEVALNLAGGWLQVWGEPAWVLGAPARQDGATSIGWADQLRLGSWLSLGRKPTGNWGVGVEWHEWGGVQQLSILLGVGDYGG